MQTSHYFTGSSEKQYEDFCTFFPSHPADWLIRSDVPNKPVFLWIRGCNLRGVISQEPNLFLSRQTTWWISESDPSVLTSYMV